MTHTIRDIPGAPWPLELGHVNRNHFAVLDARGRDRVPIEEFLELAPRVCADALADDLLVLQDSARADGRMRVLGRDGREAESCGNGSLYLASLLGEASAREHVTLEIGQEAHEAHRRGERWEIELGAPERIDAGDILPPVEGATALGLVRIGEPHLVLRAPEAWRLSGVSRGEFEAFCAPRRDAYGVEGGVNITMIFGAGDERLEVRTYERGARRQTFSCGTGSTAAAIAWNLRDDGTDASAAPHLEVIAPGGRHVVRRQGDSWHLSARAHRIARGELTDQSICLPL